VLGLTPGIAEANVPLTLGAMLAGIRALTTANPALVAQLAAHLLGVRGHLHSVLDALQGSTFLVGRASTVPLVDTELVRAPRR
jgi:hypothetical protein